MGKRKAAPPPERSVLFVCLGNICRSPLAETVFRHHAERWGIGAALFVDSAGTGDFSVGAAPDRRAVEAARRRGYDLARRRARTVRPADFDRFGWILAMDQQNLRALEALRPAGYAGHLGLFLTLAPQLGRNEVPDPYFGSPEGFERVLDLVEGAAPLVLERVWTAHFGSPLRTPAARRI